MPKLWFLTGVKVRKALLRGAIRPAQAGNESATMKVRRPSTPIKDHNLIDSSLFSPERKLLSRTSYCPRPLKLLVKIAEKNMGILDNGAVFRTLHISGIKI